ncbi:MAG: hypothetical protein R3Y64_08705 [Peptostreptococcaceae bacterium]
MDIIDGLINEKQLISYINENTFNNYNNNIKNFLNFTFNEEIDMNMKFIAEKISGTMKPDLSITHKGITKYISVKKGSGNSVHQEKANIFFKFIEINLGNDISDKLKLFHYGDGSIDDTGKIRYNASKCKKLYSCEINDINQVFNLQKNLDCFINRFLFLGNNSNPIKVDLIYHGTINEGLWASYHEIKCFILNHCFPKDTVHFGPLTYQVWGRDENYTAKHPDRRYVMQVKWGGLRNDLITITNLRRKD